MQTTLIIIKPDAVQRGLIATILSRFEAKGLQLVGMKLMQITPELAETHYAEHKGKPFYPALVGFVTSGPAVVLALRGVEAIAVSRKMMGKTYGVEAEPGTIRGDFGLSRTNNLIHGSDSPEAAERELALFFNEGELLDPTYNNHNWVYDMSTGSPV